MLEKFFLATINRLNGSRKAGDPQEHFPAALSVSGGSQAHILSITGALVVQTHFSSIVTARPTQEHDPFTIIVVNGQLQVDCEFVNGGQL